MGSHDVFHYRETNQVVLNLTGRDLLWKERISQWRHNENKAKCTDPWTPNDEVTHINQENDIESIEKACKLSIYISSSQAVSLQGMLSAL